MCEQPLLKNINDQKTFLKLTFKSTSIKSFIFQNKRNRTCEFNQMDRQELMYGSSSKSSQTLIFQTDFQHLRIGRGSHGYRHVIRRNHSAYGREAGYEMLVLAGWLAGKVYDSKMEPRQGDGKASAIVQYTVQSLGLDQQSARRLELSLCVCVCVCVCLCL